ncbi:MAG: precorrin-6Y C5,15-methyltransferase (decarboxylating) subunit CbiT, partial [Niameybacter sp.]
YFCNRIQKPYGGIHTISVHGRENSVLGEVLTHEAVFVLTGGKYRVQNICQALSEQGLGQVKVYIGEDLSYETERIVEGRAQEFVQTCFRDLAVMLIERTHSRYYPCVTAGLPDEAFYRGQVPMTKEEVRAVCLGKLQLLETDCIYDIGAGTGSVSIEMARVAKKGFVYALEKKEEAIELCIQNQQRFELPNMKVIRAKCPEGLEHLPTPQKAFIGGSGGALQAILEVLLGKNPSIHIVVTAISLETLEEVISCVKQFELEISCTQVSVANSNKIGNYHMMMGQNPIFILTLKGKQIDE